MVLCDNVLNDQLYAQVVWTESHPHLPLLVVWTL